MASTCPRCGSEILPGEVSLAPPAVVDADAGEPAAERPEVARCLCCGTGLRRTAGTETWETDAAPLA